MDITALPSGTRQLADDALVRAIEMLVLANEDFRHYDHVRLAWIYARTFPAAAAADRMAATLRAFAAHHGHAERYHDTITRVWMRLVTAARPAPAGEPFDLFLERHPEFRDPRLPWSYYSDALIQSAAARTAFVEPDLQPLPAP